MKNSNISVGYASLAARDEKPLHEMTEPECCGDTAVSCWLPDGSRAVILSDGMGQGTAAAAGSRLAARLLRRLLKQDIPVARAIKEVNRYLLKKNSQMGSGNMESFATVDLVMIDGTSGRAKFYKMGAAPSYIIRGRRIRKIQLPALPVGIIPVIRLTHVSARLSAGDIIVMMSDGISDSGWRCRTAAGADRGENCHAAGAERTGDTVCRTAVNTAAGEVCGDVTADTVTAAGAVCGDVPPDAVCGDVPSDAVCGDVPSDTVSGDLAAGGACGLEDDWVAVFLEEVICRWPAGRTPGPRQLAGMILEEACRRYGEEETDDATVAVAVIRETPEPDKI